MRGTAQADLGLYAASSGRISGSNPTGTVTTGWSFLRLARFGIEFETDTH